MDDLRVLWMRDRLYTAFGIRDPQLFEELLNRNDGEVEDLILHFLNQSSDEEGASTLFFYRKTTFLARLRRKRKKRLSLEEQSQWIEHQLRVCI